LLAFGFTAAKAQGDSLFRLVRSFEGDIADVAVDHLDQLYFISSQGQVKKLSPAGDSLAVYNGLRQYGNLFSIDVSNPLRPLLFYRDYATVVLLDRFLAPIASINLKKYNVLQPAAAGLSYDNNIWVFDEWDNKLKRINEAGTILLETPDFRTAFAEPLRPQQIISDNGFVYLADTLRGIYVFDNYGAFKKSIPVKGWNSLWIKSNNVITISRDQLLLYNTTTQMQRQGRLPAFQPYLHAVTNGSRLISVFGNRAEVYQYRF
jgi:hypothetical protein